MRELALNAPPVTLTSAAPRHFATGEQQHGSRNLVDKKARLVLGVLLD
jgi:hypothetical protein